MGTIYKITNLITEQYYIGKTINTIELRFKQHISDARNHKDNSMLHNAMRKYGYDNFIIETIEEDIPNDALDEREIFYINFLKSKKEYGNYNLTNGGDGRVQSGKLDEVKIRELHQMLLDTTNYPRIQDIADYFNMDASQIAKINKGIYWRNDSLVYPLRITKQTRRDNGKMNGGKNPRASPVRCIELDLVFETITEANKYFNVKQSHIGDCCRGDRNVALGYHWEYVKNELCKN